MAALLGCHDHEIIFTRGWSEANNFALKSVVCLADVTNEMGQIQADFEKRRWKQAGE